MKKRLKILSEFKTALPLMLVERIKFLLPYEDGRVLEKHSVDIVDEESGIIELTLTDFELQGLMVGKRQNFKAKVYMKSGEMLTVLFSGGLNVESDGERKRWI